MLIYVLNLRKEEVCDLCLDGNDICVLNIQLVPVNKLY